MKANVTLISNINSNNNGRKYDLAELAKAVEQFNKHGRHICWLDKPSGELSMSLSDAAGKVQNIWIEDGTVKGVVDLLDTPNGMIAQTLLDTGCGLSLGVRMLGTGDPETNEFHLDRILDVGILPSPAKPVAESEILRFIDGMYNDGTYRVFTEGYCYWFAYILVERFRRYASACIMYNQVLGHFAASINNVLYDITGKIDNTEGWEKWDVWRKNEPVYRKVVERDCILKNEPITDWSLPEGHEIPEVPFMNPHIEPEEKKPFFDTHEELVAYVNKEITFLTDDEKADLVKACEETNYSIKELKELVESKYKL